MKHEFTQKVYYADTDAYRVVWHGSYLRWLEKGRVELCEKFGHNLIDLENQDILLPVTTMNVRYKASARLNDEVVVETKISKLTPLMVTFAQTIRDKATNRLLIKAEFDVVAIHKDGSLHRKMPEVLSKSFEEALKCQD